MIYEDGQGNASEWWPYLHILPTHFDTLIYWSSSELAELHGSAVLEKIGKEAAEQSFVKTLLPRVLKYHHLFGAYASVFQSGRAAQELQILAHKMATLIMAYGFDLEKEPISGAEEEEEDDGEDVGEGYESNKGMVPLADLFNADGDLNNVRQTNRILQV